MAYVEVIAEYWTRKDSEERGRGLVEVLFRYLPGGTEEKPQNTLVKITVVPAKIRTQYLLNTNLKRYSYTDLLGFIIVPRVYILFNN
jgi:hypothetical protein